MKNTSAHFMFIAIFPLLAVIIPACAVKHAEINTLAVEASDKVEVPWGIMFSPNPVKDSITISFNYIKEEEGSIKIYDGQGLQIQKRDIIIMQGANSIVVPLQDLASGDYLLEAYVGRKQLGIRRITKE